MRLVGMTTLGPSADGAATADRDLVHLALDDHLENFLSADDLQCSKGLPRILPAVWKTPSRGRHDDQPLQLPLGKVTLQQYSSLEAI